MTAYETEADIRQALKAGTEAFLVKTAHPQQIWEAVRRVDRGERASFRQRLRLNLLNRCPILNLPLASSREKLFIPQERCHDRKTCLELGKPVVVLAETLFRARCGSAMAEGKTSVVASIESKERSSRNTESSAHSWL